VLVRFVEHFLFDTSSKDPGVLAAISVLLLGVGFIASYLPARRAARVDPMIALRSD
jgi:ABC-type antimicrobial peptide transport system permease subunit